MTASISCLQSLSNFFPKINFIHKYLHIFAQGNALIHTYLCALWRWCNCNIETFRSCFNAYFIQISILFVKATHWCIICWI